MTDSIDHNNSFKSYTQVDHVLEDEAFRKKTRKRLIIITLSSIVLVTIVVVVLVGTLVPLKDSFTAASKTSSSSAEFIRAVCQVALYPDSCLSSISAAAPLNGSSSSNPAEPHQIFFMSLQVAVRELLNLSSSSYFNSSSTTTDNDPMVRASLSNCEYLLSDAIDHVNMTILSVTREHKNYDMVTINDMRTWLSTAITDQETCIDGVAESGAPMEELRSVMQNSREYTSNSLAIISNLFTILKDFPTQLRHRKLLVMEIDNEKVVMNLKPNVTVAKDGSGNFTTINEALSAVPRNRTRKGRYVIYVKEGVYKENVIVGKDLWNVTMYGEGMNKTVISGSLNWVDRVPTFTSGTFIAEGKGFIGIDMGFKNTAGPEKEQAVAVRSSSDHTIFYRCSFDAYQDTLYAHSNRQFYRDCYITGTIDFIFGNAAVIFQNCSIQPRQPLPKQFNTITAQAKSDPNQNTGISIQHSRVFSSNNITNTTKTYLGRPWNDYSTTIFMESDIEGVVDPAGWTQWTPNVDPPSTIFYAEYRNTGKGSVLNQRVQWGGYRPSLTEEEANKFSVESFLQGSPWLTEASIVFDAS